MGVSSFFQRGGDLDGNHHFGVPATSDTGPMNDGDVRPW